MAAILPFPSIPSEPVLHEAACVVRRGGTLAVPTESFYALAAPALDPQAVQRVLSLKGRPEGKPILVLIGDLAQLPLLTWEVPPAASMLMQAFWPGPLTLIFPAAPAVPQALTAGTGTVGIRRTSHDPLASLLRRVGPLTGTSANRSGMRPAETAEEVQAIFGAELDLILDGGPTKGGLPSTVVETVGPVRLLREGPITRDQLVAVLSKAGVTLES